jgi:hypothetical protein
LLKFAYADKSRLLTVSKKSEVADQLRAQIEGAASQQYPLDAIELKIAASLLEDGHFKGHLNEQELTNVIRNVVYARFANQRIGGRDISLVHNVASIRVQLSNEEVHVSFLVHIHSPIIAFLRFRYVLVDDDLPGCKKITMKRGSLSIRKDTRRFDIKAKAALATIDVEAIARDELADLAGILKGALLDQMKCVGISGEISEIELNVGEDCLDVYLEGDVQMEKA